MLKNGKIETYSDMAILNKTIAQLILIEEACVKRDFRYCVSSETKFYDLQKIRDLVAYLKTIASPADNKESTEHDIVSVLYRIYAKHHSTRNVEKNFTS